MTYTQAAFDSQAGTTLYAFRLVCEWKGETRTVDLAGIDKEDVQAHFYASARRLVDMPKSSLQRVVFLRTIDPENMED